MCVGASVGFTCEVTAAFIGRDAALGHRIGINSQAASPCAPHDPAPLDGRRTGPVQTVRAP